MIYNLDVCHAVVECTPAPKAMKDMRKRKIEHRRLQLCHRPGWVTVVCLADPLIVCILVVLIMIHNWRNLQQWSRNKDAHHRNIFCAVLHLNKVNETMTRCSPTLVVSEKHCSDTARNVYVYLQTVVSVFCYWQASQVSAAVIAMILLLSGDIELNPGPLTVDDLKAVRTALWDARAKWMDIGIELDMKMSCLEAINHNKQGEAGPCLTAMLTDWLKQTTPSPTWEALVDALKSPVVGRAHLADTIQRKYCNKDDDRTETQRCDIDVTPATPSAPTNVSIKAMSSTSVTVKWDESSNDGGSSITGYVVEYSTTSDSASQKRELAASDMCTTLDDLIPYTTYNVCVRGKNALGIGVASATKQATTKAGAPSAPTILSVEATSSTSIFVKWDEVTNDGGCPITNFVVEYTTTSDSESQHKELAASDLCTTLDDLLPFTLYNVWVKCKNPLGTGAASATMPAMTKATGPTAPTTVSVESVSSTSILVKWDESSNDGGSPITGYVVDYSINSDPASPSQNKKLGASDMFTTLDGLLPFTTYNICVRGKNEVGLSVTSATVQATTKAGAPSAPTSVSVEATSSASISFKWDESSNDGGSSITGYVVEYSTTSDSVSQYRELASSDLCITLDGLLPFTTYNVWVRGKNALGTGAASATTQATTKAGAPSAPTTVSVEATSPTSILVKWDKITNDGGCSITNYVVEYSTTSDSASQCRELAASDRCTTLDDLIPFTTYNVWVRGKNTLGTSAASATMQATTKAGVMDSADGNQHDYITEGRTLEPEHAQPEKTPPSKLWQRSEEGAELYGMPKVGDWQKKFGGYDCKFVEQPPNVFQTECPICRLLLRDPYQATCCGTSFCQSCIYQVKADDNPCPTCRKESFGVFEDKRLKRSLNQLRVLCKHSKHGCKWSGELGELEHHLTKVIHSAVPSSTDVTHSPEVDSTPLAVYAENLKARYRCKPKRKDIWPPQITKNYFHLALIKEETVRKGEVSDEFTRLTITGKIEDILREKVPIELPEVFKKTSDYQKMTILMEGCPGSGKTALTQHLCLEWVHGKLFQDYKLVILVRLREPAIHKAKDIKDIIPRAGMEGDAAKEIEGSSGRGVLFILDGWDELPEDIPGHDTIYSIISGETLPECDVVITSRPTSSASLHDTDLISSRIEILGFTSGELHEFFTEHLDGDASKANTLLQRIKANPIVAGTCALPLNAVILVHIFKQHGDLPTTEHGIFDALIQNCILRHVTERTQLKTKVIKSLTSFPPQLKPQYHELCKIAYEGVMKDQVIFELDEDFNTLGLLQGVECYTGDGTQYFYNFLHLSIQEFLAAHYIATAFEPAEQVAKFDELFGQARFSSTFRHYSAITKLATTGIDKIVLRIVKRCAGDSSGDKDSADGADSSGNDSVSDEDKAHLLSLLNCLREADEPSMYNLMADNLGSKLDLEDITLNLADCLSITYFLKYITDIEINLDNCSIEADGIKMLFSQDQVYQIRALDLGNNEIRAEEAKALSAAMKKMVTLQELVLDSCEMGAEEIKLLSAGMEKMVHLQKLDLGNNEIGPKGVQHLQTALEKMVNLQKLNLESNQIGSAGCEVLSQALKQCTKLEHLNLENNQIGSAGCEVLSQALKQCTKLEHLNLRANRIGPKGAQHLQTALEKMVNLHKLDLQNNQIGSAGCEVLSQALKQCTKLEHLNLESNQIGSAGCEVLSQALKQCTKLEHLNLRQNEIGPQGCKAIANGLKHCTKLEYLNLAANQIADGGCSRLGAALEHCRELQVLDLYSNQLGDGSVETLCDLIKTAKCLEWLNLRLNHFTREGKTQLREATEERNHYTGFVELKLYV